MRVSLGFEAHLEQDDHEDGYENGYVDVGLLLTLKSIKISKIIKSQTAKQF